MIFMDYTEFRLAKYRSYAPTEHTRDNTKEALYEELDDNYIILKQYFLLVYGKNK